MICEQILTRFSICYVTFAILSGPQEGHCGCGGCGGGGRMPPVIFLAQQPAARPNVNPIPVPVPFPIPVTIPVPDPPIDAPILVTVNFITQAPGVNPVDSNTDNSPDNGATDPNYGYGYQYVTQPARRANRRRQPNVVINVGNGETKVSSESMGRGVSVVVDGKEILAPPPRAKKQKPKQRPKQQVAAKKDLLKKKKDAANKLRPAAKKYGKPKSKIKFNGSRVPQKQLFPVV